MFLLRFPAGSEAMTTKSERAIEVFTEAIQLPAEERVAFLGRACAADEDLRQQIESLLKANDRVGDFLETPPTDSIGEGRANAAAGERPGDQVDRYKLVQKIGEGGCGVVFVAEQEGPIRRRVALKIVKPGMDTKSVIARFEAERQALALMYHSNIAQVFDAGTTRSGRPFFVMEFVDGVKITEYCDRHSLSTSARLKLFVRVCEAIQHAHQKGIIHRDIKPSNILVTMGPDGEPAPKVIDFGIAKAIGGQQLTDKTILTAYEMLLGTPAYMSPEQAALTSDDMDTRTDIYSLGVLLYELLTGTTPFDTHELLKQGFDEVRRVIRDVQPALPSTRLSTLIAANLVNVSKNHGAQAAKLIRELRGDLDWIVMKALEKDRARRYPTANGLAMDVGRYLSGEAVLARPPSTLYKTRKLISKNKLLFSSVAMMSVLLAAGLGITTRLLIVEKRARERAQNLAEVHRLEAEGTFTYFRGDAEKGEKTLRESFAIRRRFLDAEPPNALTATMFLSMLDKQKKSLDALLAEFPTSALRGLTGYALVIGEIGYNQVAQSRWKEAAPNVAILLEVEPDNSNTYHTLVPLLVASGDVSEYRRRCQEIIVRFASTTNVYIADKMAKDCLILPSSGVDLNVVAAMANLAVIGGSNSPAAPFFQCCKALAEYRQGHHQEAINWAHLAAKGPFPHSKAEAAAIIAMSQFKLNQLDEAQTALADCDTIIEKKLPKLGEALGQDWRDWIIAHALQSEAKQMINGVSSFSVPPR